MEKDPSLKLLENIHSVLFSQLAEKAALALTPVLFSRLIEELYPPPKEGINYTPPPIEVGRPLYERLYFEILEFTFAVEGYRKLFPKFGDFLKGADVRAVMPVYTPVADMVYTAYKKELEEYKRQHKEDLSQTVAKAKDGNRKAILKLVKWDKTWLQWEFVQKHIMVAQFNNDTSFFENLADAIRKKSNVKKISKEENILQIVKFFSKMFYLKKEDGYSSLHEVMINGGILEKNSNLFDFKYFMKKLRRHRIA